MKSLLLVAIISLALVFQAKEKGNTAQPVPKRTYTYE